MTPQDGDGTEQPNHKLGWLWVVLAVILAGVAVGTLWWWKASNQKPVATCNPKDMSLRIGETEQTAATNYIHAVVTNNGKTACTVEGYPVVSALDSAGENYTLSAAQTNPYFEPRVVTLPPQGHAYVAVGVPKAEHFDEDTCSDASATLRLFLPAEAVTPGTVPLTADFSHQICPGFSVTAFIAGS